MRCDEDEDDENDDGDDDDDGNHDDDGDDDNDDVDDDEKWWKWSMMTNDDVGDGDKENDEEDDDGGGDDVDNITRWRDNNMTPMCDDETSVMLMWRWSGGVKRRRWCCDVDMTTIEEKTRKSTLFLSLCEKFCAFWGIYD